MKNNERRESIHDVQQSLFERVRHERGAFFEDHSSKDDKVRKRYESEFVGHNEALSVIFGLRAFLRTQDQVNQERRENGKIQDLSQFQILTEYQFLLNHYVLNDHHGREALEDLWKTLASICRDNHEKGNFEQLKRGILGSVAVFKALKKMEQHPHLSHPQEDAYSAIDMWVDGDRAIQAKSFAPSDISVAGDTTVGIIPINDIADPASEIADDQTVRLYNEKYAHDIAAVRRKIHAFAEKTHKHVEAYMVVIPHSEIDQVTGEPSARVVEELRRKLHAN